MAETNRAARREAASRWARRWSASVAVTLAGAVAGAGLYLGNQAYIAANSPASCGAGCVTNGSVALGSDPGILEVEADIANANRSATSGGSYASVVLLDPFTYSTSGTVSLVRMTDELRGAYLAQQAANDVNGATRIQLLLANEGTSAEEGEAQAVRQIKSLEGPDHIVAVAGMGLSTANTQTAATALVADGMPMFGALTTGDQFNGANYQGFYQVIPDVDAQVQTLRANLKVTKGQSVALISSDQATDIYSTDLQIDFSTALDSLAALHDYPFDPATASQQFATIATTICGQPGGSPVVLFAGREAALPTLVQQFQQSAVCDRQNVTIVTGSDSNALPASVTSAHPGIPGATVTIEYSDIEDAGKVSGGFKTGYKRWLPPDIDRRTACLNQLYDPWAVATYNSVMAAVGALRHFPGPSSKQTVASNATELHDSMPYTGAAGPFGFNVNGQLAPADIPVYRDSDGTCSQVSAGA
jgi:hypothetical protein